MIGVALRGLRAHPAAFFGAFVSIALAVALVTITLSCAIAAQHPDVAADDPELATLATTLLANAAAVAILAAAFVASSTLSYSAVQRRRELALLRLGGASAARVSVLLLTEAVVVGVLAAALGVLVGWPAATWFADLLASAGFAPAGLARGVERWPAWIAAGIGIASIVLGALPVAIANSRVPPIAALREADAPRFRMTATRWVLTGLLAVGVVLEIPLIVDAEVGVAAAYLVLLTITVIPLLVVSSPLLVRGILTLLALPLRRGPLLVAITAARVDLRRTAATATPMLVTIGLAAAILSSTATITASQSDASADSNAFADTLAILSVVGLTLVYTGISVAVTFAMSTAQRRRELSAVRLAGTSRAGAIGIVALDVVLIVAVAVLQAAAVTAIVVLAAVLHLGTHTAPVVVDVPIGSIGVVVAAVAGLATVAAVLTARTSLTRSIQLRDA